jgi:hypothetical protein
MRQSITSLERIHKRLVKDALGPNIAQTRVLFNGIAGLTQGFSKVSPTVTLSEAKGDNQ